MGAGRAAPWLLVLALLLGCASGADLTPQQARTYAAWEACKAAGRISSDIQLTRVTPGGRYYYHSSGSGYGYNEMRACMAEEFSKR